MRIRILIVDKRFQWPEIQKEMIKKEGGIVVTFIAESHKDADILNIFRMHFLNIMERTAKGRQMLDCEWSKLLEVVSEDGLETSRMELHIWNTKKILSLCLTAASEFIKIFGKACSVVEDCEVIERRHKKVFAA